MTTTSREVIVSRRQTLTALRWSAVLTLLLFGACMIGPTTAQAQTDSAYTADTTAIVRDLYLLRGPGKRAALVPVVFGIGMLDRHAPDGVPSRWTTDDKVGHLFGGAMLALALDDRKTAWSAVRAAAWGCLLAGALEVGQMRPSRFPAAGRNTLGVADPKDFAVGCGGAVAAPIGQRLLTRWAR